MLRNISKSYKHHEDLERGVKITSLQDYNKVKGYLKLCNYFVSTPSVYEEVII